MSERKTMFGEAKSRKYADIVRLDNVGNAQQSVKELKREFREAKTRDKRVTVKRVTVNASNRAFASAERRRLSTKERIELRRIGWIYKRAYKQFMFIPSRHARKR